MQYFDIGLDQTDSCQTCCCQEAVGTPGEIDKWALNYSPKVLMSNSQRLGNDTQFFLEKVSSPSGSPVLVLPLLVGAETGVPLTGDLSSVVTAPSGATMKFRLIPFTGPEGGSVSITENGQLTYSPLGGWTGIDRFFWAVSVNGAPEVIQEAVVNVGPSGSVSPPPGVSSLTPPLSIKNPQVSNRDFVLSFGLRISPSVPSGEKWRLTVKQTYSDCDNCYSTIDCFDILIGRC